MKKIKSLFQRNYETDRLIRDEVVPGSEWVLRGDGIATRKFDGTCCMVKDGELYKRYDAKRGKTPPDGFIPAQEPDPVTGHWPGWLLCRKDDPADRYHIEALAGRLLPDGTYELCGEKIQGNPEKITGHALIAHGCEILNDCPRDFEGLKEYLKNKDIEGVVFYAPDGEMVKVKKKDFGFKRMKVCLIYSGHLRTWEQCKGNHAERLTPAPAHVVHYNETAPFDDEPFTEDIWGYNANKAPENEAWNTMNMWRAMWRAWERTPQGLDVYVRMRYDIVFDGVIDFTQYDYPPNRVYIPDGNDYRDGVNDQMAFGSYDAMEAYYSVYFDHKEHFAAGKMFHSESYLKYTLDKRGINIVRIPVRNSIVRP